MQFSKKKIENKSKLMESIADTLKNCSDFTMQKIISENSNTEIYKLYFNMLINVQIIDEEILKPLANNLGDINNTQDLQKLITEGKIYHSDIKVETDKEKIIEAMLDGIEKKTKPPLDIDKNIYQMDDRERKRAKIETLPGSLYEALMLMKKSSLVKSALGEHIFKEFLQSKLKEWDGYRTAVTKYELDMYLERY